jgi:hypothetical protein
MDLPEDIKIQGILTQGGAFKTKLPKDSYERFYFILNHSPQDDTIIVLSTSTTQFELHRNCPGGDDVHLPLSPNDYKPFYKECLICCNWINSYPKESILKLLKSCKFEILPPLPLDIIEKIKLGVAKSPRIPPKIKNIILGTNE